MCRFTAYLGPPIRLASLLVEPEHSLIHQSFHADERREPLNGDGFGVGWYAPELSGRPAVFRSVTPAWNNANLRSLADVVASGCIMAHVRAATEGMPVDESNCHPFRHGRLLFMHNGGVRGFRAVRRRLMEGLGDEAFNLVFGSTDTEHVFAVFIDELAHGREETPEHRLAAALNRAVWRVVDLVRECTEEGIAVLNLAVSDGETIAACRFVQGDEGLLETLYFIERELYEPVSKGSPGRRRTEDSSAFVISSERLTDDWAWTPVPSGQMVAVSRDSGSHWWTMDPSGLEPVRAVGDPA